MYEGAGLGNRFAQELYQRVWMLVLLMPPEVRRNFMMPLLVTAIKVTTITADGLPCPLEERTDAGRIDVRNCL